MIETREPHLAKLRRESDEPKWRKSKTDIADPSRTMLLREREEATCTASKSDNEDPKRATPNTDSAEPIRT